MPILENIEPIIHTIYGQSLQLLSEGAILWVDRNILFIADLHLGKVEHFRKEGFPLPVQAGHASINKLEELIKKINPEEVIFLGDLFHSNYNSAWITFKNSMEIFHEKKFTLVIGNHDILSDEDYSDSVLEVVPEPYILEPFILTHHPEEEVPINLYNLCGHIHPAVRLKGRAMQSMRLPCFYFSDHVGILPAFGTFTGSHTIQAQAGERVYVVADDRVIAVQ